MKIFLLLIPLLLLVGSIASTFIPIYLYAKAKGDFKGMSSKAKKTFIFFLCLPLILFVSVFIFFGVVSHTADTKLKEDLASGAVKIYRVSDMANTAKTTTESLTGLGDIPYMSFDLFADPELYVQKYDDSSFSILTSEFDDVPQIKKNSVGFIRISRHGALLPDAAKREEMLKKEHALYKKSETELGTVFEIETKETDYEGRFMYEIYFANSDYSLMISTTYVGDTSPNVRVAPVISREYAKKLYDLITSTLKVDPLKLQETYPLIEAI